MRQYRLLIDLLHTAVVSDGGRMPESMVQVLRCQELVLDVPTACGWSSFLGNHCKVVVITFEAVCTDEHVSLVLCTPVIWDGVTRIGHRNGGYIPLGRPAWR